MIKNASFTITIKDTTYVLPYQHRIFVGYNMARLPLKIDTQEYFLNV